MEKHIGNRKTPDFDKLNDRIIADAPKGPMFAIKTNLDTESTTEENPYVNEETFKSQEDLEKFDLYFREW